LKPDVTRLRAPILSGQTTGYDAPLMDAATEQNLRNRLLALRVEHRDLDDLISRLVDQPGVDQLRLQRLKKRKLRIKDEMALIESRLIPDLDA
jgi:hypothetical protein